MYVGIHNGRPCMISPDSPNNSICITGLSGTGKTSRLNQIELARVLEGETVLVLDVNRTHANEQIFPYIRNEYMTKVNRIHALNDGLGLSLFQPMQTMQGEVESFVHLVNSAVQALSSAQGMGIRQIGALRKGVIDAIKNAGCFNNEGEALAISLQQQEDTYAEAVYQKLWTLLHCGALRPSTKCIQPGLINIIDLSGTDMITQTVLSEMILSNIWRQVQFDSSQMVQSNLIVVMDEFQNLALNRGSALRSMLAEGRRHGLSVLLATQTMAIFQREVLGILNQAVNQLYFRPAQNEVRRIAKQIEQGKANEWIKILEELRVGECVATGDFLVDGVEVSHPLLLK